MKIIKLITLLNLLIILPLQAMDVSASSKEDLYLVVGSTRSNKKFFGEIIDKIQKVDQVDLSHEKTFAGQATTMDIAPCDNLLAHHIVGDARVYDFKGYNIKEAYLERLPTYDHAHMGLLDFSKDTDVTGACIKNIAKAMDNGAKMTIEWHPYTFCLPFKDPEKLAEVISDNPFNGLIDIEVAVNSLTALHDDRITLDLLKASFGLIRAQEVTSSRHELNQLLTTLASISSIDKELLQEIVKDEVEIWKRLFNLKLMTLIAIKSEDGLIYSRESLRNIRYFDYNKELIGKTVIYNHPTNPTKIIKGKFYDSTFFFSRSFINYLLSHLLVKKQSGVVKAFMADNGFENITITLKESFANNRKNVWIIEAFRNKTVIT